MLTTIVYAVVTFLASNEIKLFCVLTHSNLSGHVLTIVDKAFVGP